MFDKNYLQKIVQYKDGFLFWKERKKGRQYLKPIGTKSNNYLTFMIDGKQLYVHRVIYAYHHNEWPITVDHINGIPSDNRIENLRSTDISGNTQNIKSHRSDSKSKLLGAFYSKKRNKWFSAICINNKRKYIGTFKSAEEAHNAYIAKKRELHLTCTI